MPKDGHTRLVRLYSLADMLLDDAKSLWALYLDGWLPTPLTSILQSAISLGAQGNEPALQIYKSLQAEADTGKTLGAGQES